MRQNSTVSKYLSVLEEFALFLAERDPLTVDRSTVEAFIIAGSETPSRPRFNNRLAAVRAFYAFLLEADLLKESPAVRLRRQKVVAKEPLPLSLDEYLTLVEAAERFSASASRPRNVAVVELLFHVGLRVSELVALDVDQVDLSTATLHRVTVKGGKTVMKPLNDVAIAALERYLAVREYLANEGETALLVSNRGTRLSVRAVQELVVTLAEKAGIARHITCHLLRHSNASELASLGTPISVIQSILGHEKASTTERYITLRGDLPREALRRLSEAADGRRAERNEEGTTGEA